MPLVPEYQALFEQMAAADPQPPGIETQTPIEGREMYRIARPVVPELPIGSVEDRSIPGPVKDIPIRIPQPQPDVPISIYEIQKGLKTRAFDTIPAEKDHKT